MDTGFVRDLPLRNLLRVAFALVLLGTGGLVASHALAADGVDSSTFVHEPQGMDSNLTVVTTHFNDDRKGSIAAFNESGDVVYRNASYTRYFDVDPVPGRNQTVTYIAEQNAGKTDCGIAPWSSYTCVTQIIERLDLRTDETRDADATRDVDLARQEEETREAERDIELEAESERPGN